MGGRSTIEEKLQQEEEHQKEGKEWARAALKMAKQNYQK
jgi:6,7-dimethyl-8-ribityllumazine synthase